MRGARSLSFLALCSPGLILVGLIIVLPIGWLFWLSLFDEAGMLSGANYARFFEQSSYLKTFLMTFKVAFLVTGLCVLIGYPVTYMLSQIPRRAAAICLIFVVLPFWTSVLVRTYAWLVHPAAQRPGEHLADRSRRDRPSRCQLAHNFAGVIIGMTHILLPFLVLPL